ncbi:capsule biosynthesis GfcC family protein [Rahnella perminowiae]|uniref:capsule biosynthesis GfcC family protein n=1 Tax=Rahnella perminowiae TaxID=2816244 RepID=UPI00300F6FB4
MKIKTLLFLFSTLPGMAFSAGNVTVYTRASQGQPVQTLSHIKDMRQMMAESDLIRHSWAPGTVIAVPAATSEAQQQYLNMQNQLKAWSITESGDTQQTINRVIQQLQGLRVTGRQFTPMDADLILNNNAANRQLQGDYRVYTATRADNIWLLGAVSGAGKQPWVAGRTVREYLGEHQFLAGANLNEAVVIDPNGTVRVAPVAYWNYRHVEAQPGSIIWVGFSDWTLPRQYKNLNQSIVSVLAHRIPD